MKELLNRAIKYVIFDVVLWAMFLAYQWWSNDSGVPGKFLDPMFYVVLAPCVVIVSIVQSLVEIRDDREERRRLEGDW